MKLPQLNSISLERNMITTFGGYNAEVRTNDNEFQKVMNLCSDAYPCVTPRKKRGIIEKSGAGYNAVMHRTTSAYGDITVILKDDEILVRGNGIADFFRDEDGNETSDTVSINSDNEVSVEYDTSIYSYTPFSYTVEELAEKFSSLNLQIKRQLYIVSNNNNISLVTGKAEMSELTSAEGETWKSVGVVGRTSDSGIPVYRASKNDTGDHLFTKNTNEYYGLSSKEWNHEGFAFYSCSETTDDAVPVYRLSTTSNPIIHFYTVDKDDRDAKIKSGTWGDEGIAFYLISAYDSDLDFNGDGKNDESDLGVISDLIQLQRTYFNNAAKETVGELTKLKGAIREYIDNAVTITIPDDVEAWVKEILSFIAGSAGKVAEYDVNDDGKITIADAKQAIANGDEDLAQKILNIIASNIGETVTVDYNEEYDLNRDGIVNLMDAKLAMQYEGQEGNKVTLDYNEEYDVNGDGYVSEDDISYVESLIDKAKTTEKITVDRATVTSGNVLYIFPENKYLNLEDLTDNGNLSNEFLTTYNGITYEPSTIDGAELELTISDTEPSDAEAGDYWLDTSQSPSVLMVFSSTYNGWTSVAATYTRLQSPGIGKGFEVYDGIRIGHIPADGNTVWDTSAIIWGKDDDYIVVAGIIEKPDGEDIQSIIVQRRIPVMDYVIESDNRLWGCRFGKNNDGEDVNEIYACKLGDPKNWFCYMGTSTDAYAASLGTEGVFTGAVNYGGHPIFFKESCIHKVYGNYPSNYQITTTKARGVQKGSSKSLVIIDETLYYKSPTDVCAYAGSLPETISEELGKSEYTQATAGALDKKYYIQMKCGGNYRLLVYDTEKGMWHEEENIDESKNDIAKFFEGRGDRMYYVSDGGIYGVFGNLTNSDGNYETIETETGDIKWSFTFAPIGYDKYGKKNIGRIIFRVKMSGTVKVTAKYDGETPVTVCDITESQGDNVPKSRVLAVVPHRCELIHLTFEGTGDFILYSLTKVLYEGSDL